jgi:hypothetical protein
MGCATVDMRGMNLGVGESEPRRLTRMDETDPQRSELGATTRTDVSPLALFPTL